MKEMRVINSERYLKLAKEKLLRMQKQNEDDISLTQLSTICFNLNKIKEYEDNDITTHELIDLLLNGLDKELKQ